MRASLALLMLSGAAWISPAYGSKDCDANRLNQLLNALERSLEYMDLNKAEVNLDGLVGVRMTSDQMLLIAETFSKRDFPGREKLISRLEHIANVSKNVVEQGEPYVKADWPAYYAILKNFMGEGSWRLQYPQRSIDRRLQREALPCNKIHFNVSTLNMCLSEVLNKNVSGSERCNLSTECLQFMTVDGYRDYYLTHELIYFQLAETHGCVPTLVEMGYNLTYIAWLQDAYCADVLRDAEEIAQSGYPPSHQDLFFEQIAICGLYGFTDFWKEDWIDVMLDLQKDSGCYVQSAFWKCQDKLQHRRVKRTDKILHDGCSSHMTGVGMMALTMNIRFCMEAFVEHSHGS